MNLPETTIRHDKLFFQLNLVHSEYVYNKAENEYTDESEQETQEDGCNDKPWVKVVRFLNELQSKEDEDNTVTHWG